MDRLALQGGPMVMQTPPRKYNAIGGDEVSIVRQAIKTMPLSGFLGGQLRGGHYIQRLEELWSHRFRVRHSIACNSATSGLLAACSAVGVGPSTTVATTPFTMSATAAAPKLLGANVTFGDIEPDTYSLFTALASNVPLTAIIVTNLFGHPAHLARWKRRAEEFDCYLIEDNAQAILSTEDGQYAGTIGDVGVFSLNVHKHIQVGEGGVICTNDDGLAKSMRAFINHGEMAGRGVGLNLRMTEYTAAMAIAQLMRIESLVGGRVSQAVDFIRAIKDISWIKPPVTRENCTHSYYVVPLQYRPEFTDRAELFPHRDVMVDALMAEGLPMVKGYVEPLTRLKAFQDNPGLSPVSNRLHDEILFYFSNCEWTLDASQFQTVTDVFAKVGRAIARGELQCSSKS